MHEIGRGTRIDTPFGRRLITYADLTATGRYLGFLEDWFERLRPYYANTHTEVSSTGRLMTNLREDARRIVHRAVGAGEDDVVLFVGAGATAAINKLVGLLGLRTSEPLDRAHGLSDRIPRSERPVVFVGPYEHHSNLLPWLESIADTVEIGLDGRGHIDLGELAGKLEEYVDRALRIGSFSAASNVTGVLSDVPAIARLLHDHGALAFFDYAAAGPYVPIDMQGSAPGEHADAIFLSTHKFIGGPECSGLLVAHRDLFRTRTPERPGGGTVDYVVGPGRDDVDYVASLEVREEGGTPAIMSDLRTGAAFLVKDLLGPDEILRHEIDLAARATERLARHPRIDLLGPTSLPRLAILSLSIHDLHHDLASALLDHLFGIQNRAGCACAGPYGHALLGIDRAKSDRFRQLLRRGINGMKPGWIRISLPYYASDDDIEFILSAVEFVADHGLDFVQAYRMSWRDGVWRHVDGERPVAPGLELSAEAIEDSVFDRLPGEREPHLSDEELAAERARYFEDAHRIAADLRRRRESESPAWNPPTGEPEIDELAWFRYLHTDDCP